MEIFVKENAKEKRRSNENTRTDNQDHLRRSESSYSLPKRHSLGSSTHFGEWRSQKDFHREQRKLKRKRSIENSLQEVPKILPYSRKLAEKQFDEKRPKTYINCPAELEQEKPVISHLAIKNSLKRMDNCLPMRLDVNIKPMYVIVSAQRDKKENFQKVKQMSYPKDFKRRISLVYDSEAPKDIFRALDVEISTLKTQDTFQDTLSTSFTKVSSSQQQNNGASRLMMPSNSHTLLKK